MKSHTWRRLRALVVFCATVLLIGSSFGQGQEKHVIPGPKGLPFSDGIAVGNTLYIAGQQGTGKDGKLATGGIGAETEATLRNVEKVVKEAGFELKDIVAVTVYLADIKEFSEMNKAYKSIMPDPKPTRATVQVSGMVNDARVEISAIAVKQK